MSEYPPSERAGPGRGWRIGLYHDYFAIRGGGERLALELANGLDAELIHAYRTAESYPDALFPARTTDLQLAPWLRRRGIKAFALAQRFFRERRSAEGFDVRIFSGTAAPFAAPPLHAPGRNIYYCHTPPRFLYDQRQGLLESRAPLRRAAAHLLLPVFQNAFEASVARMHTIVANSETVRQRIARYLGRDSIVVNPPVDISRFSWSEPRGYYLSTARLVPLKRVGRVIDTFKDLPDLNLVVASGGEDETALRRRAADAPNIRFTGWIDDEQLHVLLSEAIATIYVPVDEDFGMSPVESMAAGKPVIGVAEGGLRETILHGRSGILLAPEFTNADLAAAIRGLGPEAAAGMRGACLGRARAFTLEKFVSAMSEIVAAEHSSAAGAR